MSERPMMTDRVFRLLVIGLIVCCGVLAVLGTVLQLRVGTALGAVGVVLGALLYIIARRTSTPVAYLRQTTIVSSVLQVTLVSLLFVLIAYLTTAAGLADPDTFIALPPRVS